MHCLIILYCRVFDDIAIIYSYNTCIIIVYYLAAKNYGKINRNLLASYTTFWEYFPHPYLSSVRFLCAFDGRVSPCH